MVETWASRKDLEIRDKGPMEWGWLSFEKKVKTMFFSTFRFKVNQNS